jgi:hypothetical protein
MLVIRIGHKTRSRALVHRMHSPEVAAGHALVGAQVCELAYRHALDNAVSQGIGGIGGHKPYFGLARGGVSRLSLISIPTKLLGEISHRSILAVVRTAR